MKIELTDSERGKIARIAVMFGEDENKLARVYKEIMECNFEQDVWDIAKENEEELMVEERIKYSKKKGEQNEVKE